MMSELRTAQLFHYRLPIKTGLVLRQQTLHERQGLIVRLQQGQRCGWGEIAPLPSFSHEDLPMASQQASQWLMAWQQGENPDLACCFPSVAFGISCALAELAQTLGEQGDYQTVPLYDDTSLPEHTFSSPMPPIAKLKVGRQSALEEGRLTERCLQQHPALRLRLDANRAWSLAQATQFAEQLSPDSRQRIQFIEEPCQSPEQSRQFAEQQQIAIAWDESGREPHFRIEPMPYLRAIIIKPTLVGSLTRCATLIEQAHQQGLMAVISSSIETSLGLTQLARFAHQFTPNTIAGLDTLHLMQHQLLRLWPTSPLPLIGLKAPWVRSVTKSGLYAISPFIAQEK